MVSRRMEGRIRHKARELAKWDAKKKDKGEKNETQKPKRKRRVAAVGK
jgi:hypothetical protein